MLWQFSPYAMAFFITGGIFILLACLIWRRRHVPGGLPFFILLVSILIWNIAAGMEVMSIPLVQKIFWSKIEYLGSSTAAPLLLIFSLEYTRNTKWLSRRNILLILVIPIVILGFTFTNEWHRLIWSDFTLSPTAENIYIYHHGVLYWLYMVFNYICALLAAWVILRSYMQLSKIYQPQLIGLLIGIFIPIITGILYSFNINIIPGLDISPLSFSFTGIILFLTIHRHLLFDIVPVARQVLFENLTDSVLILDMADRIIDINAAAQDLFSVSDKVIGKKAIDTLSNWENIAQWYARETEDLKESQINQTPPIYLSVQIVSIKNQQGIQTGRIINLRDITPQKQAEIALRESERKYRSIFENSQVGIFRTNIADGKMLECNDKMAQILGYTDREELLDNGFVSLEHYVNPDDRHQMIENLMKGEIDKIEIQFFRPDKTTCTLEFSARIFPDVGYLQGVAVDITERKRAEFAEREQRLMAEALRDIAGALNSTLNLNEVLDRILENIGRLLPYNTVDIILLDEHHEEAHVVRCAGYEHFSPEEHSKILELKLKLENTANLKAIYNSRCPLLIDDITNYDWVETPQTKWIRSNLCAPIIIKGEVEGFLSLSSDKAHYFLQEHMERLQAFADQSAIAIENARLFSDSQLRNEQMSVLYRIGQALTSNLELDQVLTNLYEHCCQVLPMDTFYVAVYQEQAHLIIHPLFMEQGQSIPQNPRDIRMQPGLSGEIIWNQKTLYIPDMLKPEVALEHQIIRTGGEPTRSFVGVPLTVREKAIGVISMQCYLPNAYNDQQITLLETIANQAAIGIENASLFEQMKQLAITDPLTELYNRRFTEVTLTTEFKRCERYGTPLAVGFFDIDDFKLVNDRFGHACGDDVLKVVADQLKVSIRFVDFAARIGGDEFLIVFPNTTQNDAWEILNRFRNKLRQCIISCTGEFITISGGVTPWRPGITPDDALNTADLLMYQAKRLGKNQIIKENDQNNP